MPGQRPQRISIAQALALLTSIAEEDSGESDASDWEEDQHHANDDILIYHLFSLSLSFIRRSHG